MARSGKSEDRPNVKPREPWDLTQPEGYMESDRDYVLHNLELCVMLLDEMQKVE